MVSDAWSCYHWIDAHNSGYRYSVHNHSHGDFGYGLESTSHIKQLWAHIKMNIKKFFIKFHI